MCFAHAEQRLFPRRTLTSRPSKWTANVLSELKGKIQFETNLVFRTLKLHIRHNVTEDNVH